MGVGTEQVEGFVTVTVATLVVAMVVGEGAAVRMQEHALLSLDAGYAVVVGRSRFALPAVTLVLLGISTTEVVWCLEKHYLRSGICSLDGRSDRCCKRHWRKNCNEGR